MLSDNIFRNVFYWFWVHFRCENWSQVRPLRVYFHNFSAKSKKCDFEQPSIGFAMFFVSWALSFRHLEPRFWVLFPKWFLRLFFHVFWKALVSNLGPKSAPKACKKSLRILSKKWCRKDAEKVMRASLKWLVCVPKREPETSTRHQKPIASARSCQNISITPPVPGGTVADIYIYIYIYTIYIYMYIWHI